MKCKKDRRKSKTTSHVMGWREWVGLPDLGVRASRGGALRLSTALGSRVKKGEPVGVITDPTAGHGTTVKSRSTGIVVGLTVNPLVSLGDAVVHVAELPG